MSGVLQWLTPEQIANIDVIETTRAALPLLMQDIDRDPLGLEPLRLGVADYRGGNLTRVYGRAVSCDPAAQQEEDSQ
jgi:hypothetical protein